VCIATSWHQSGSFVLLAVRRRKATWSRLRTTV
jgi:hypothetical protein